MSNKGYVDFQGSLAKSFRVLDLVKLIGMVVFSKVTKCWGHYVDAVRRRVTRCVVCVRPCWCRAYSGTFWERNTETKKVKELKEEDSDTL